MIQNIGLSYLTQMSEVVNNKFSYKFSINGR